MARQRPTLIFIIIFTFISSVLVGVVQALEPVGRAHRLASVLNNVRDYAPALSPTGMNYAIDGGVLFAGIPFHWLEVPTPANVIVSAVAVDSRRTGAIYIGAANELAIYRSTDGGQQWLRIPLRDQVYTGGVTDIAVDSKLRLVYVGTDTAGIFRLRDVGSSVIAGGHLAVDEPVLEVVTDDLGAGLAFARTAWQLYRADHYGLHWVRVENLASVPTALAITNFWPITVYVGTMDRGVLKSEDGLTWTLANEGLGLRPGSRLAVNALSVDPQQPDLLYVATSYLFGSTEVHRSPVGVAMSTDGGASWSMLQVEARTAIVALWPVSGETSAVYALTEHSRRPLALGHAPAAATVTTQAPLLAPERPGIWTLTDWLAWLAAGMAALALLFVVASDLRARFGRRADPLTDGITHPLQ